MAAASQELSIGTDPPGFFGNGTCHWIEGRGRDLRLFFVETFHSGQTDGSRPAAMPSATA